MFSALLPVFYIYILAVQAQKQPVPSQAEQGKAQKVLRDLYKEDYAKTTRADRVAFAQKLLEAARGTKNDPNVRYVLLTEAEGTAAVHGDLKTAFAAIDELAAFYEVDPEPRRASAVSEARKAASLLEAAVDVTKFLVEKANEAASKEAYEEALKWAEDAKSVVKGIRDASLVKEVLTFAADLVEAKKEFIAAKKASDALTANFDDKEAAITYGRYLTLIRFEWEKGCRLLAKGPDGAWKEAGKAEIGAANTPEAGLERGEAWLQLAAKETGLYKRRAGARGRYWLETTLASSTGITRAKVDRRLDELDRVEFGPGAMNIAKLFNAKSDALAGDWKAENSGILSPQHILGQPHKAVVPFVPGDEYDLRIILEKREGFHGGIGLALPSGGQVVIAFTDGQISIAEIEGKPVTYTGAAIVPGKVHNLQITVRRSGFAVRLNGAPVLDWKGDLKKAAPNALWAAPGRTLYLTSGGSYYFSRMTYVPVTGVGKSAR